jgi:hypothetical protein
MNHIIKIIGGTGGSAIHNAHAGAGGSVNIIAGTAGAGIPKNAIKYEKLPFVVRETIYSHIPAHPSYATLVQWADLLKAYNLYTDAIEVALFIFVFGE